MAQMHGVAPMQTRRFAAAKQLKVCRGGAALAHAPNAGLPGIHPSLLSHCSLERKKSYRLSAQAPATEPAIEETVVEEVKGKEEVLQVTSDVLCFRATCEERLKFAIQYGRQRGTTDNSYLLKGTSRETTVLIDIPYETFAPDYTRIVEESVGFGSIGHIIMTHVDLKGIQTLKTVLQKIHDASNTSVEMHLSPPALSLLRSVMGDTEEGMKLLTYCNFSLVKSGDVLELGGKKLEFIRTATARWPDLTAVYLPSSKVLFSSKYFSAHAAPAMLGSEGPYDEHGWQEYGDDWKYYFDCMFAPTATQVGNGLKRLGLKSAPVGKEGSNSVWARFSNFLIAFGKQEDEKETVDEGPIRPVSYLCPMHGPIVKNAVNEMIEEYMSWIVEQNKVKSKVAVFYASAYGHTATLAQAISRGVSKSGIGVETVNLEVADTSEVSAAISNCDAFVIGSPTLGGHMPTQVQSALGTILRDSKAKQLPCGVFGSFGWSGEAVDELDQRLRDGGFSFGFDPIKVKLKPTAKDLQVSEESGTDLAQAILKKAKRAANKGQMGKTRGVTEAAQALGRVVGSLCVLTARAGETESGMLASWISQASFDPPGISVAVKKDRAMEDFFLVGGKFNVNVLGQGREKEAMKAMLKPFKPGEDRFANMDIERSEGSGCVILREAISLLECTVESRMDAGDHWVIYATIQDGAVRHANVLTAVHHRKVGTSY